MSEYSLHLYTAQLLRLAASDRVLWYHVPNGESRSARTGAKLKLMGVRPGVADFSLVLPGGRAAFLELKSDKGRQSISQRQFQKDCEASGALYFVASSPEQVRGCLEGWGAIDRLVSRSSHQREAA